MLVQVRASSASRDKLSRGAGETLKAPPGLCWGDEAPPAAW